MGVKSRRKGKRGELQVGRLLYTAHYGTPPPPDRTVFVRTKPGVRQHDGDLVVPDDFPFLVEVKNRSICLSQLLTAEWQAMLTDAYKRSQQKEVHLLFVFKVHHRWWVATPLTGPTPLFFYFVRPDSDGPVMLCGVLPLDAFCAWWRAQREGMTQ